MQVQEFFTEHPKAALGFSGGVDSSYLLYAGIKAGADIRPYFIKTAFQPEFELEDAKRLCAQLGAELYIIELDALANPDVVKNPANRCYYCKTGHKRFRRRGRPAGHEGTDGNVGALPASPVRPQQGADPRALPRGRSFYMG